MDGSIALIPTFFLLAVLLSGVISVHPLEQIWVGSPLNIYILITAAVLIIPAAIIRRAKSNPVPPMGTGLSH